MSAMAADLVKRALYRSGLLGLYHRLRNRRALTVIMFHRVLTEQDPRWPSCDPDYTLEAGLLERCLAFFRRHYNVVSADEVLAARRDGTPLPDRALLITFDDGWADNHAHALPRLRNANMPALLFAVADAIDRDEPFFQERLIAAFRLGRVRVPALLSALADRGLRLPEAKQLIEKAVQLVPDDGYILDSLGWVEFKMGRMQEARKILEQAMKMRPDAEIAAHLGEVLWASGDRDGARKVWRDGQRLNPENETLLKTLKRFKVTP